MKRSRRQRILMGVMAGVLAVLMLLPIVANIFVGPDSLFISTFQIRGHTAAEQCSDNRLHRLIMRVFKFSGIITSIGKSRQHFLSINHTLSAQALFQACQTLTDILILSIRVL